ncbi:hypothetical protein QPK87_37575 [Kamptonema cortianum]|nr:hypothetical protein [Geitlerinema splendidum]MDK3162219.1 hypothetical protein [Kamptonema cortianum]
MAKKDLHDFRPSNSVGDALIAFLDGGARLLLVAGGLAAIASLGILLFQLFGAGNATQEQIKDALAFQDMLKSGAVLGMLAAGIGATYLFWGEEVSGPILLIVGFGLALIQWYYPMMSSAQMNQVQGEALQHISIAGYPAIFCGFILIAGDVIGRMKLRVREGAKAEQMKYGKGAKEERDVRNVFMGKCWQLPYCRKFVRERCPIYHAKRTCWKERVGCMCEESVIKNAMEGKVIPSDLVAASKFIPQNNKLTPNQKAERCRQCVIYNEHQKHKYKLVLPIASAAVFVLFIVSWTPLAAAVQSGLKNVDSVYTKVTMTSQNPMDPAAQTTSVESGVIPYHHIIVGVTLIVALAYVVKMVEFFIWKLKV